MIEKDEFLKDEFLRELIKRSPLDSPSDDFVDRVMATLQISPEIIIEKRPFFGYLKAAVPYSVITIILFLVVVTSDLPIFNWLPGKAYFINNLLSYVETLFMVLVGAFSSKFVSWGFMICGSAGMLFLIDWWFGRRTTI